MKKRALGLSGKAAMEEEGAGVLEGEQTKENHAWFVIRGIPLAILEPLPPAHPPPRLLLLLFFFFSTRSSLPPSLPSLLAQRPRAFLLVYGIFFTRTAESYIREG